MRAALLAMALAITAGPAAAGASPPSPRPRPAAPAPIAYTPQPNPPIRIRIAPLATPRASDQPLQLDTAARWDDAPPARPTANLDGSANHTHITRYKLEGVDLLGGSVSGTLDVRGARLTVRWPPGEDD